MKPEKFETFARGSLINYAGIENLIFDGVCYDHVYLKDTSGNEEAIHVDQFNLYGKLQ